MIPGRVTMKRRWESPGGEVTYIGAVTEPLNAGTVVTPAIAGAAPRTRTAARTAVTSRVRPTALVNPAAEKSATRGEQRAAGAAAHGATDQAQPTRTAGGEVVEPAKQAAALAEPDTHAPAPARAVGRAPCRVTGEDQEALPLAGRPQPARRGLRRLLDGPAHQPSRHRPAHRGRRPDRRELGLRHDRHGLGVRRGRRRVA